eukprot:gene8354-10574_t
MKDLAAAMARMPGLTELDLASSGIDTTGAERLARVIRSLPLRRACFNCTAHRGWAALLGSLSAAPLTSLLLNGCSLEKGDAAGSAATADP